ncbi:hypothetical protein Peur_004181 [Populus x canadensis]
MASLIAPDNHVPKEDAEALYKACKEELLAVKRACKARYKHSLEEDLAAHTTAFRYEGDEINARLAYSEADILHDAIKDKEFNHEEVIRILTARSKTQLTATFNRYRDDHGSSITKALLDEPAEEFKTYSSPDCHSMHQQPQKILRIAIREFGTDEDALTRVIVTRAEKDWNDIKEL